VNGSVYGDMYYCPLLSQSSIAVRKQIKIALLFWKSGTGIIFYNPQPLLYTLMEFISLKGFGLTIPSSVE
jgi:hypothetical protein